MERNLYLLIGTILFVATWLFAGIFYDDEFNEAWLFTKYRPTFKSTFYSPIGMSDMEINDLPVEKQTEEIAFREFVVHQNQQNNSNAPLWYLPPLLIQATQTFLCFGIMKTFRNVSYKKWHLPMHFLICVLLSTAGIALMLRYADILPFLLLGFLILTMNYSVLLLLMSRRKTNPI